MNLFDYTQRGIEDQANAYAKMSDKEATRAMLYKAGAGIAGGVKGMLGVEDPDMKKASEIKLMTQGLDLTTAKGLKELAIKLGEKGYNQEGTMAAQRANDLTKAEMEAKVKQATIDKETRLGQKAEFDVQNEKDSYASRLASLLEMKVPESQAKALASSISAYTDFMKSNTKTVEVNGKVVLINEKTGEVIKDLGKASDRRTSITNVMPGGGTAKLSDILPTLTAIRQEQGTAKESITQATQALNLLSMNNPKADAQVDRALATLAGDKQLSQAEVIAVANAGSFPQGVVDSVSKFFTGQAGTLSKEQKRDLLKVLKTAATKAYNNNKSRLKEVLSTSELSEKQVNAALGEDIQDDIPSMVKPGVKQSGVTKSGVKYTVEN